MWPGRRRAWHTVLAIVLLQDFVAPSLPTPYPHAFSFTLPSATTSPSAAHPSPCALRMLGHPPTGEWGHLKARQYLRLRGGREEAMEVEEDEVIRQDAEMQESEDESEDEDAAHGVVPAEMTLLQALDPALGEDDDYNRPQMPTNFSSFSITITEGLHNLTDGGELPLCRRTHLSASKGVTLAAYAQPRPRDSLVPTHGGGRLRYMADSTGSTMSGIVMTGINIQCVILTSSAVLVEILKSQLTTTFSM